MSILEIAKSQLGKTEIPLGSNKGVDVEKYLKSVGLGGGYPWCMSFVYWTVEEYCKQNNIKNPLIRTGGVLRQWNEIPKEYKFTREPRVGDIFIMDFGRGTGHTGFVTKVDLANIYTLEGNSDSSGSRTGGMVCENKRLKTKIKGYIRIGL